MTRRLFQTGKKKESIVARGRACAVAGETWNSSVFAESEPLLEVGENEDSAKSSDWGKMRESLRRSWGVDLPHNAKDRMES